tara:strand:+ start:956 stop:1423 length:468 start_codon:yes stop_codon:yes gene_type:complete
MKKNIIFYVIFISLFLTNIAKAEIEKGKWNFIKEKEYCYIGSLPIKTDIPEGKSRGDVYILVYRINRSKESIVQINAGYPYKEGNPVIITVDKSQYEFYSKEDSAWTENDNDVIYAMKKGNTFKVAGISSRGTKTIDEYTLTGFTAAYNKLTNDC